VHAYRRALISDAGFLLGLFAVSYLLFGAIQYSVLGRIDPPYMALKASIYIVNTMFVMTLLVLGSFLLSWRKLLATATLATLAFMRVNQLKIANLGEPVLVFDAYKIKLWPILISYVGLREIVLLGLALAVAVAIAVRFYLRRSKKSSASNSPKRVSMVRISVATGLCVYTGLALAQGAGIADPFGVRYDYRAYEQLTMTRQYGYFVTEALNLRYLRVTEPPGYGAGSIKEIVAHSPPSAPQEQKPTTPSNHVVLILLESFIDYPSMGIGFETDFLPNFRKIKRESQTHSYISPTFGGGTANAEYEVLTGMVTGFLPSGSIPYSQYIKRKTPSVVGRYAKRGYQAIAIHNNNKSFWSRDSVYRQFGFSQFLGPDELRSELKISGDVKDRSVFAKSVQLLETATDSQFQFLITLDTHGPYDRAAPQGKWYANSRNRQEQDAINVYADKMSKLDQDLGWYFEKLKALKNPPTVILFGDHHPSIGSFLPLPEGKDLNHRVEAVFWNWKGKAIADTDAPAQQLSCLSSALLKAGPIPLSPFYRFVDGFCKTQGTAESTEQYSLLCFDRLFGEQYSLDKATWPAPVNGL
jgi:phosphoglycerol transferase MdoB-like AlkP superfamily enzyme